MKFVIDYIDGDCPYAWQDEILKEFDTFELAQKWCDDNSKRRDSYRIKLVDGVPIGRYLTQLKIEPSHDFIKSFKELHGDDYHMRVLGIKKFSYYFEFKVDIYSESMCTDDYEASGFVYLESIEDWDQKTSLNHFKLV